MNTASESTRERLETLANVLLRCWILGFVVLFVWLGATLLLGDVMLDVHAELFDLTDHELDLIMYCSMVIWKLAVLVLYFIPWLSIKFVLRKG